MYSLYLLCTHTQTHTINHIHLHTPIYIHIYIYICVGGGVYSIYYIYLSFFSLTSSIYQMSELDKTLILVYLSFYVHFNQPLCIYK